MRSIFSLIIITLFIGACVNDNIEDLKKAGLKPPIDSTPVIVPPVIVCDSSVISFSAKIKPLLETKCGSKDNSCHTGSVNGSTQLNNYAGVKRVAADGKLRSAVTWDGNASRMPDKQPKLDDCTIYLITSWIDQGMQNN